MQQRIVGHFFALGGGNEIGRSMYVYIFPELKTIVIKDCGIGMRPRSKGEDTTTLPEKLEEFVQKINQAFKGYAVYVFFSHGHNDHIGAAAKLYLLLKKHGIPASFFSTEPTHGLIEVMGNNGIGLRESKNLPLHHTRENLEEFLKAIIIVRSSDWITLENGCRVRFVPSGHIRGAASIEFETPYGSILYSGDLQSYNTTTVRGAPLKFPGKIRWLVMESTNGDLLLPDPIDQLKQLEKDVLAVAKNGGHCLLPAIPSRGQDIAIHLARALRNEKLRVYMAGLMRAATCSCYHSHWESDIPFQGEDEEYGFQLRKENIRWLQRGENKFGENRLAMAFKKGSSVFVVPNGMLQGSYSLVLARAIATDPKSAIFFINFQGEETNGRRFSKVKTGEEITLDYKNGTQKTFRVLAQIKRYGLSGHSDQKQLTDWVRNMDPHDGKSLDLAILVHGDRRGQYGLQQKLLALENSPKQVLVGANNRVINLYA